MAELVKNLIGGKWLEAKSGATFESLNPATEEVLAHAVHSGAEDVLAAVAAAKDAYDKWRLTPAPRRGEILFAVAEILKQRKQELAELMTKEMGKIVAETGGDVQEAIDMAYFMGGEG